MDQFRAQPVLYLFDDGPLCESPDPCVYQAGEVGALTRPAEK
jgi:hypothetical protein